MTKAQAVKRLVKRWHAQVERYDIPLALYLQRNVPMLLTNERENERHAAREAVAHSCGYQRCKMEVK